MQREPVTSSNIAEIGYDPQSETLEILFSNGGLYQYFNVPAYFVEQLRNAASIGGFFNAEIKNRFPEARL